MLARGSGFDANDNPLWNEYPDVCVWDGINVTFMAPRGRWRGYRLDGGYMDGLVEAMVYLTEHVGMTRQEADAYLKSLDHEVWDDFFNE